jgi:hypothetical protein
LSRSLKVHSQSGRAFISSIISRIGIFTAGSLRAYPLTEYLALGFDANRFFCHFKWASELPSLTLRALPKAALTAGVVDLIAVDIPLPLELVFTEEAFEHA